jgi:hypothetical protein
MGQCKDVLKSICCPEVVNSKDSPEGMAYQEALDRFNAAHCVVPCPAIACIMGHGVCMASSVSAGQCVLMP